MSWSGVGSGHGVWCVLREYPKNSVPFCEGELAPQFARRYEEHVHLPHVWFWPGAVCCPP
jgi:hypothetical protein